MLPSDLSNAHGYYNRYFDPQQMPDHTEIFSSFLEARTSILLYHQIVVLSSIRLKGDVNYIDIPNGNSQWYLSKTDATN